MKRLWVVVLLIVLTGEVFSQSVDSVSVKKWFVPDYAAVQYAGSIGMFSGGIGYRIGQSPNRFDLLFGYVPDFVGDTHILTTTIKFTSMPWKVVKPNFIFHPLTMGIYLTHTPGEHYNSKLPSWYPEKYYWWSEAIRPNIFLGSALQITRPGYRFRKAEMYWELGTNEIKLVSYALNTGYLNLWKIAHAGIGVRWHFR